MQTIDQMLNRAIERDYITQKLADELGAKCDDYPLQVTR